MIPERLSTTGVEDEAVTRLRKVASAGTTLNLTMGSFDRTNIKNDFEGGCGWEVGWVRSVVF